VENQFNKRITVPEDYFNVEISNRVLQPLDENVLGNTENELFSEEEINVLLNNNKIGQQILSYWFARKPDGGFDLKAIQDKQVVDIHQVVSLLQQSNEKRVSPEKIKGLDTVNETYMILVDFKDIQTMSEYYDANKIEKEHRLLEGFFSAFDFYLIKLDFNNAVASHFFNNYLITESTEQNVTRKQEFVTADFPFILIKAKSDQVASTKHIQAANKEANVKDSLNERLLGNLVDLAVEKSILDIESENKFYKYSRIQRIKPLTASMGINEGLKFDRRYSVFINQINDAGKVEKKRVGIVKSMKIVDNRPGRKEGNDLSEFYQIGGKKITASGMYLEKNNDIGINLLLERSFTGPVNMSGRIEYYFSKLFDGTIPPGKRASGLASFKIYLEGGYNNGTYFLEEAKRKFEFLRGAVGVGKDFYHSPKFYWSPFVAYGIESTTYTGSKNSISTNFVETGLQLGINIFHNLQVIGTVKNDFLINSILLDGEREVLQENFNYNQTFPNRKGVSVGAGLRLML
jgi:hypothetical protein